MRKSNNMKIKSLGIALLILLFIVFTNDYGETRTTEGGVNNIFIGDSKQEVYEKLPSFLASYKERGDKIFIRIKASDRSMAELATKPGYGVLVEPQFHDVGENSLIQKDRWVFYVNADSLDLIELRFENSRLIEIYTNKRVLELP